MTSFAHSGPRIPRPPQTDYSVDLDTRRPRGAASISGAEILELLLQVVAFVGHDALEDAHALFDLIEPREQLRVDGIVATRRALAVNYRQSDQLEHEDQRHER